MLKLGSHVSMKGASMLEGSVEEALSYGANAFMVYTGAPQNTKRKAVDSLRIEEAHARMEEAGIALEDVVIHAPYIINLANADEEKRAFAVDFLIEEVKRSAAIGAKDIVLHPGNHLDDTLEKAVSRVAESLDRVLAATEGLSVRIALETMSGKGTEVGRRFEELAAVIEKTRHAERLFVCFDTCHTHDAGYDVKEDFAGVMREFDRIIGLDRLSVFHINDSKNPRGANKDRHANLGLGHIGFDALAAIVHDAEYAHIPKILETPYVTADDDAKKRVFPPYKEEIAMLKAKRFDPGLIERIRKNHSRKEG